MKIWQIVILICKFLLSSTFYLYVQMIVQHGVFFDSLVYSTLANNLAKDVGTVFDPCISKFIFSHFNEPLTFGIYLESVFFKLLGPAYFFERLYSFTIFTLVITLLYEF
ncbi:MAG: hypothetical protein SPLUMA2_SPLUMAMAG2_00972 [uncultured Sulfurimonas sp.]|nr:MAG: hypothetical protein SPLUMA1_SPLUMAMAG1_01454 [uncultured Sulfurimonas sp.]CAI6161447.1 MAG: hypothetical protein SPLUMA2_SPLUMAMAG2_00972 [uncultured Sulfurimonas sp.]